MARRTGRAKSRHRRATPTRRPPATAGRTLFEISAGGVIHRTGADGVEVCLIATKGGARWQLPKGKREANESLEETAAREVAEETGLVGRVGPRLDKVDLWYTWNDDGKPVRHHKLVYFYLLTYEHGSTSNHDAEVHEARWFPAADALARLTFASERRVLQRALDLLAGSSADGADVTTSPTENR
jgi:8-oxo-dGTP pyrophosphatase MutT (NUDIX family)